LNGLISEEPAAAARCLICDGSGKPYAIKNGCSLYCCSQCKLIFVWPMPADSLAVYEGDYFTGASQGFGYKDYDADKQVMVPTFQRYLRRIARYLPPGPGKRVLDVGAATGFFLNLARKEGWEPAGIEPSDTAASLARQKNLEVKTGVLVPGMYPSASFDVITLWDVLEHVPDPVATMSLVVDMLKPGGIVAINTPDASSLWAKIMGRSWHLLCPPEHLCLFSHAALDRLLGQTGLTMLERDKIGKSFTLQYVAQTLAHWRKSKMWDAAGRLLQGSSMGRWGVPLNLYDNFFVLARKHDGSGKH
jgi:SAM-dependent methyltransferase